MKSVQRDGETLCIQHVTSLNRRGFHYRHLFCDPLAGYNLRVCYLFRRAPLIAALENGYYETPRGITMSELADEFGISQQAFSKRLRGAHQTVVENSLTLSSSDTDSETDQKS